MKKSKVIIPALGVLILSTAASVTGTVAWFTANRTGTITTGNFAVVKTDGNLDVAVTGGVGTDRAKDLSENYTIVNPKRVDEKPVKIGDISFNPSSKQLWNDTGSGTAFRTIGDNDDYQNLTDADHPWKINSTTYHAFTWKVTVSYTWGADLTPINIFFDYSTSTMTGSSQASGNYVTEKGFRIALIGSGGSHTVVWAGLTNVSRAAADYSSPADGDTTDPGEAASVLGAVYSTSAADTYGSSNITSTNYSYFGADKYAFGNVAVASSTKTKGAYTKAVDGDANQDQREDYLAQIAPGVGTVAGNKTSIDVICVAWYEGTDSAIVNDTDLAQVASTIGFYGALNA